MSKIIKLQETKPTKCCKFVLPMCGINPTKLPFNFINSYIYDDKSIILIFEKLNDNIQFENFINKNNTFIKQDEIDDKLILYYNIPNEYLNDFNLFKLGSYSKFSQNYKNILTDYYGRISIKENYTVTMYNTIYPQEFKRKQIADRLGVNINLVEEVLDKPDLEEEQYIQTKETNINEQIL